MILLFVSIAFPVINNTLSVETLGRWFYLTSQHLLTLADHLLDQDEHANVFSTLDLVDARRYNADANCTEIRLAYAECCQEEKGCGNCPWVYECQHPPPEPSPQPSPSPEPADGITSLFVEKL